MLSKPDDTETTREISLLIGKSNCQLPKYRTYIRDALFLSSHNGQRSTNHKSSKNDSPTNTSVRGGGRGGTDRGLEGGDVTEGTDISTSESLQTISGGGFGRGETTAAGRYNAISSLDLDLVFSKL